METFAAILPLILIFFYLYFLIVKPLIQKKFKFAFFGSILPIILISAFFYQSHMENEAMKILGFY